MYIEIIRYDGFASMGQSFIEKQKNYFGRIDLNSVPLNKQDDVLASFKQKNVEILSGNLFLCSYSPEYTI